MFISIENEFINDTNIGKFSVSKIASVKGNHHLRGVMNASPQGQGGPVSGAQSISMRIP